MGIGVLPTDSAALVEASVLSAQLGLLSNNALVVALIRRHALSDLVTNDDDFDAIAGLTIWKPR